MALKSSTLGLLSALMIQMSAQAEEAAGPKPESLEVDDITEWENTRRSEADKSKEIYRTVLENRRNKLAKLLPLDQREKIEKVSIKVIPESTPFLFESKIEMFGSIITTSTETFANLQKIAGASALTIHVPELGDEWLLEYLYYMRSLPGGAVTVDPFRASGYLGADGSDWAGLEPDKIEKIGHQMSAITEGMLMFLIAHEFWHLTNPRLPPQLGELKGAYRERVRLDEARADQFAIDLLEEFDRSTTGPRPFPLAGAPFLFLSWVYVMEGAHRPLRGSTHPLDHERALTAANAVASKVPTLDLDAETREFLIESTRLTVAELSEASTNPEAFFAKLDRLAGEVTLDSLRRR